MSNGGTERVYMELKHQCANCEFNLNGICTGSSLFYGRNITDDSSSCEYWNANTEYFSFERIAAPRFLRDNYNNGKLSYVDFSAQHIEFDSGVDVPINIFDAVKYIYGLSIVDIAVLANVTYSVAFWAKTRRIPQKRIQQFCDALCISENTIMSNSTSIFDELRKGKKLLFGQEGISERLSAIPDWKQKIVNYIIGGCLNCPTYLAIKFARIDTMYWEKGMNINEYTESERALISYYTSKNKNVISIDFFLDIAGMPHICVRMKENQNNH